MRKALIIGAGYLGTRLETYLSSRGFEVFTTITSASEKDHQLHLDINQMQTWQSLDNLFDESVDVYCLIPPSRLDVEALQGFIYFLERMPVTHAVMSSSTVVYGSQERTVDADSLVEIESHRAERQWKIEQIWRSGGEPFRIIRLAGLYGPGRVIGQKALQANAPINSTGKGYLNLLYIDDAVTAAFAMMHSDDANTVELACDDHPVLRDQYYQEVARLINSNPPVYVSTESGSQRQCQNDVSCRRLDWRPEFTDYRSGLLQALKV